MDITLSYLEHQVVPKQGETVLEAFERTGVIIPSSCRAGACQFCMVKAVSGTVPRHAQNGVKPSLAESGHFLACVCKPTESLTCEPAFTADFRGYVFIEEIETVGEDIAAVRFATPDDFKFTPGQFATFRLDNGAARSYSLASPSESPTFEIHVRKVPNGIMSGWLHTDARPGDRIWMEGPKGDCVYYPGNPEEHIVLVGTGTGMAPLLAVAKDALSRGHQGPITAFQGAITEHRLYLKEEFIALADRHENFSYKSCLLEGMPSGGALIGDLKKIAFDHLDLDAGVMPRVYLCGDPGLVRHLKKQFFLRGVSLKQLHSDPFIGTAP